MSRQEYAMFAACFGAGAFIAFQKRRWRISFGFGVIAAIGIIGLIFSEPNWLSPYPRRTPAVCGGLFLYHSIL